MMKILKTATQCYVVFHTAHIWLRKEKAQAYIIVYSGSFNLTSEIVKFSNKREDIKISAKNNHANDICNYFTDIPHWG